MSQKSLQKQIDEVLHDLRKMQRELGQKMLMDAKQGRKYSDDDRALLFKLNQTTTALERNIVPDELPDESWVERVVKARLAENGE